MATLSTGEKPDWIRSTTNDTFRADVIDESMNRPVVVDFWAEWCQPCRQMMPALEAAADELQGRICLVKVNIDECGEIASAFGVQSIPFVVAVVNGQPVSQFQGAQSPEQIRAWLEQLVPSPALEAFDQGQRHETDGAIDLAEASYRKAVEHDGTVPAFKIALARVLLGLDREQECREIIDDLNTRGFLEPEAEALQEQLEVRERVDDSGGVQEARNTLEADPADLSKQLQLAEALGADNRFEEACEICLAIIRQQRDGVGEKAKEVMVGILTVMGPKSKLASQLRRQLATAFY
jgi:putative thioredoxin